MAATSGGVWPRRTSGVSTCSKRTACLPGTDIDSCARFSCLLVAHPRRRGTRLGRLTGLGRVSVVTR
jgi:hypothetical protein